MANNEATKKTTCIIKRDIRCFLYCVVVLLHNQTSFLKTEIINLSSLNFLYLQSYIKQSFFDL